MCIPRLCGEWSSNSGRRHCNCKCSLSLSACRLALITYSGQPVLHFAFNSVKYGNNSAVIRYLNSLRSMKGITATHLALHDTFELFANRDGNSGKSTCFSVVCSCSAR